MLHVISETNGNLALLTQLIERCPKSVENIVLLGDTGFGKVNRSKIEGILGMFPKKFFYLIQGNEDIRSEIPEQGKNFMAITTARGWFVRRIDGQMVAFVAGAATVNGVSQVFEESDEMALSDFPNYLKTSSVTTVFSHDAPLSQYLLFKEEAKISLTNIHLDFALKRLCASQRPVVWVHGTLGHSYLERYSQATVIGLDKHSHITLC